MLQCAFCDEIKNGLKPQNDILSAELYSEFGKSRIIFKTDYWSIVPTVGCFVEGYVLAINKSHFLSLYECDDNSKKDFVKLICTIEKIIEKHYNRKMIFFEHGTIKREYSSCSMEHVHVHFMPISNSIWGDFTTMYNPNYYEIANIYQLKDIVEKKHLSSYLLFRDINGQIFVIEPDVKKFPSQFFRFFISKFLGMNDSWNWKKNYYIENMYNTYEGIRSCIQDEVY